MKKTHGKIKKIHGKIKKPHGKIKNSHDKCPTHAEIRAYTEDSGWYRYDGPHWFPGSDYLCNYNAQNDLSLKFLRVLIFAGITLVSYLVLL